MKRIESGQIVSTKIENGDGAKEGRSQRHGTVSSILMLSFLLSFALVAVAPSASMAFEWPSVEWEGSKAEDVTVKGVDAMLIRPLAAARVVIGAILLGPASLLSLPGGLDGVQNAYEVLIVDPVDYAFRRELGDL